MKYPLLIIAGASLVFLLYLLAWRILSRFINLPCPPGYIFLLDSPLINRVAGAEILIERAGVKPGMKVLDAGCGPGRLTIPLAKILQDSGEVSAFDMQPAMLDRLQKRLTDNELDNVEIIQGQFGENLLRSDRFDRVFLVSVLGEIPDQVGALREIHQALVPGGILSITEVLPDPHYQRKSTVIHLAGETGFQVDTVNQDWRSYTINLKRA